MHRILITIFFSFMTFLAYAQEDGLAVVAVGKAEAERAKIAFLSVDASGEFSSQEKRSMEEFMILLSTDFSYYKKIFEVASPASLRKKPGDPDYDYWSSNGFSVVNKVTFGKDGILTYQISSWSITQKKKVFEKSGPLPDMRLREIGHEVTDELYKKLTGKNESIFKSKILFVSDRESRGKNIRKELYIMDFDGKNKKQLTNHGGTVISPAISHDGKKVLYSLIKEGVSRKNVNLYVMDMTSNRTSLLSSRPGINSGAVFMPDNQHILLTLSHSGNAEIYRMNINDKSLMKITNHYTPDVDPSINRAGDRMAFLSGRPGKPMIYLADPRGLEKDVKRVSFVGQFNATPRYSPDGSEIAFASWMDNRFDIFRIDAEGQNLSRLTKDFGSNEDPTYSNDGQFIAFSSQRVLSRSAAVQNIYIMDRDGEIIGSITKGYGNCITPRWSR